MSLDRPDFGQAIIAWRQALGEHAVLADEAALAPYQPSTTGATREIRAALQPTSTQQVISVVKIAQRHLTPLYPISTGRNWGYGCSLPVTDGCVLVDLSRMNRIISVDADLGLACLQPGVTQRQLYDYFTEHNLPFMVPVHGGGPDCSLVGNALERGYGITPYVDHFGAVNSLEAVLPDGSVYQPALSALGGAEVDRAFKWGIGPYLDGLFSQGSFGIVTEMTITLARKPEWMQAFFFQVDKDEQLEEAVLAVREVLRTLGPVVGSINLMNSLRILSMTAPYPFERTLAGNAIPAEVLADLTRQHRVAVWTGAGAIYGNCTIGRAARSVIKKILRRHVRRVLFASPRFIGLLQNRFSGLLSRLPSRFASQLRTLDATLRLMNGEPSTIALPLAYWKSGKKPPKGASLNPARDGCGLMWFSPLVVMKPDRVRAYVEMVKRTCAEHGIDPLITLTSLSERCFDSTMPLLFDRSKKECVARAQACFEALNRNGLSAGFLPYRVGINQQKRMAASDETCWDLVRTLKKSVDPHSLLAPGRFSGEFAAPPEAIRLNGQKPAASLYAKEAAGSNAPS
jgi:4-cresol dehydrogenase (hydroxylating) flavoprotein subunit